MGGAVRPGGGGGRLEGDIGPPLFGGVAGKLLPTLEEEGVERVGVSDEEEEALALRRAGFKD